MNLADIGWTFGAFVLFTGLVALITWLVTRREDVKSETGFFLAGRSLTWPVIAGSLLLTNLSTEQMVGLNGSAFKAGLSVMVWEVAAVVALLAMAVFFLPRFLKSGIATVPQLLEIRFGRSTQIICNLIFLLAYATILLPIILYTGAQGLVSILNLKALIGILSEQKWLMDFLGIEALNDAQAHILLVWVMVWVVGIIGSCYALFGGLRSVAISDLLNGVGLLVGGLMITYFGFDLIGGTEGAWHGVEVFQEAIPDRLNSIGGADAPVPFWQIFTGVMVINLFYWCTNQQIIQRTLAARNLEEGQKGVLCCALLKLLGPLYLVLPGMMAYYYFVVLKNDPDLNSVEAYGTLVRTALPPWLSGFFCAVMVGAILSSFNSALNSTCTLFSLGLYKHMKSSATEQQVVRSGRYFGIFIALVAMTVAPLLIGQESIFDYLQKMNGIYFIPIFAVVLMGLLNKRVPTAAANFALIAGCVFISLCYFVLPLESIGIDLLAKSHGEYHFLGIVFLFLLLIMHIWGMDEPRREIWVQQATGDVDLTPWRWVHRAAAVLLFLVILIYWAFADFSVL